MMHVYLSPEHAGKSTATLAGWDVDDVEGVVDELASKGVALERYEEGPIVTDEMGIATFEGEAKVAYFRDPHLQPLFTLLPRVSLLGSSYAPLSCHEPPPHSRKEELTSGTR
jgi:hypothetical protein